MFLRLSSLTLRLSNPISLRRCLPASLFLGLFIHLSVYPFSLCASLFITLFSPWFLTSRKLPRNAPAIFIVPPTSRCAARLVLAIFVMASGQVGRYNNRSSRLPPCFVPAIRFTVPTPLFMTGLTDFSEFISIKASVPCRLPIWSRIFFVRM